MLNNGTFQNSLENTVVIWIINFIPQISLALLLTAWFTGRGRRIRGQGAFKVMFYLPNIITAATVAILYASIFGYPVGPVNDILASLKILTSPFDFSTSPWAAKLVVAFIQFWMWYGYTAIVLISGVLGINPELFESAEIDGATPSAGLLPHYAALHAHHPGVHADHQPDRRPEHVRHSEIVHLEWAARPMRR